MRILKNIGQGLLATLITLLVLEAGFRLAGFPQGSNDYIETILYREKITKRKPAGEFRIFAYGESTMHGSHYGPYSNPARWLEAYLKDFLPHKKIRVVNLSRMGQGSRRLYHTVHDTVQYRPDLVIFYTGHNAFIPGNRKDQVLAEEKESKFILKKWLRKSSFFSAVERQLLKIKLRRDKGKSDDSIEYAVIETPAGGMGEENSVPNNTPAYKENIEFFKSNLRMIYETLEKRKIKALFFKPVGNLKDFSPYMSVHLKPLSPEDLKRWEDLYEKGKTAQAEGRAAEALSFYEQAYAIDSQYADLCFRMGQLYFRNGELEKARKFFEDARDYDSIKVRAPRDIHHVYEEMVQTRQMQYLDTEKILNPESPGGILGEPLVEDNVHFSIKAHSILGRALASEIANRGWIAPIAEWKFERERSFEEISRDLGVNQELIFSAYLKMVHYFGKRYDNRIRFAQKAVAMKPQNPKALRHMAWSYWIMGEKERALEAYKKLSAEPQALEEVFNRWPEIRTAYTQKFGNIFLLNLREKGIESRHEI